MGEWHAAKAQAANLVFLQPCAEEEVPVGCHPVCRMQTVQRRLRLTTTEDWNEKYRKSVIHHFQSQQERLTDLSLIWTAFCCGFLYMLFKIHALCILTVKLLLVLAIVFPIALRPDCCLLSTLWAGISSSCFLPHVSLTSSSFFLLLGKILSLFMHSEFPRSASHCAFPLAFSSTSCAYS